MLTCPAFAATYYIDFTAGDNAANGTSTGTAWKSHPYMVDTDSCTGTNKGLPSYSHSAGDIFVFKGGETWPAACFPMSISTYGTAGNIDTFTGGQLEGTPWGTGYPVFDAEESITANRAIMHWADNALKYTKVNGIKLYRAGISGNNATNTNGIRANGFGSSVEISNMYIECTCNAGIVLLPTLDADNSALYVHHNYITKTANMMIGGRTSYTGEYRFNDIKIYSNEMFDPHTELVNGDHGDGIHLWSVGDGHVPWITNLKIYNNKWYGDWSGSDADTSNTAVVYLEHAVDDGLYVYNNHATFSNTTSPREGTFLFGNGFFVLNVTQNAYIYNNSFSSTAMSGGTGNYGTAYCMNLSGNNVTVKNNSCLNTRMCYFFDDAVGTGVAIDNNVCLPRTSDGIIAQIDASNKSVWANWTDLGYDGSGYNANPAYAIDDGTASALRLTASSPGLNTGADLGASYNTDILGTSRPQGAAYDIGAYEYYEQGSIHGVTSMGVSKK